MAHVLLIGKYYDPFKGGIEYNTRAIAEIASINHEVTVLVGNHRSGGVVETIGGVRVIRRDVFCVIRGQPFCRDLLSGISLDDFDVVHLDGPNAHASLLLWLRLVGRRRAPPLVVTHHMDIVGRRFLRWLALPFIRAITRSAHAVIVTSAKNAYGSRDLPRGIVPRVLPLGIDVGDCQRDVGLDREAHAWRHALCGDSPVVGFCGRLARYKGLDVLMRALVDLPEVRALIAGSGEQLPSLHALAAELGISSRVLFLGQVDHRTKLKLLTCIDCFVFPSIDRAEAFGIAQMEAMLCGAPVIASDLPTGVTDVAIHEKTALLFEPGNSAELAQAIRRIIADPDLAHALSRTADAHVRANLDQKKCAARTVHILEEAAHARRAVIERRRARGAPAVSFSTWLAEKVRGASRESRSANIGAGQ